MTSILVAEDDPSVCDFLTDLLEAEFAAKVRGEQTGSLALQAIETAGFDLAIIDANLPEISGYELARQAADRNIPTLLSSGHPDADSKLKKLEFPYLAKPYRVTDLICASAIAITQAAENIRRVKASLAKLEATSTAYPWNRTYCVSLPTGRRPSWRSGPIGSVPRKRCTSQGRVVARISPSGPLCHVWTAPWMQEKSAPDGRVDCDHVFGLT